MPRTRFARLLTAATVCTLALAPRLHTRAETLPARRASGLREVVVSTASMSIERMAHTATTLPDGRVLVAGGFTSGQYAAKSAELYSPVSERFSPLPRMQRVRHSHTATLLPNGKVLIVGGFAEGNITLASAELFDPRTNTFVSTGSLRAARSGHAAVPLPDGRVLVIGGLGPDWAFLSSAELYDPATGTFSSTGAMSVARESHVALRLLDGRVLVVGGHRDRRADITLYTSAELYDAKSGTFRRVGDMHTRRHKHDGIVLRDGRVLITGGSDERDDRGAYSSTELFDPGSLSFVHGPSMKRPRYKHNGSSVLLSDGRVLVAGGASHAEMFDPRTGAFTDVAGDGTLAGQFSAIATIPGGRVLMTGGYGNGGGPRSMAWLYRP